MKKDSEYLNQYYTKKNPKIDPLEAGLPKEPVTLEDLNNTVDKILALGYKIKNRGVLISPLSKNTKLEQINNDIITDFGVLKDYFNSTKEFLEKDYRWINFICRALANDCNKALYCIGVKYETAD